MTQGPNQPGADSEEGGDRSLSWRVHRMDDNGNEFEVGRFNSRGEAEAPAAEFESRGHKQSYWVSRSD